MANIHRQLIYSRFKCQGCALLTWTFKCSKSHHIPSHIFSRTKIGIFLTANSIRDMHFGLRDSFSYWKIYETWYRLNFDITLMRHLEDSAVCNFFDSFFCSIFAVFGSFSFRWIEGKTFLKISSCVGRGFEKSKIVDVDLSYEPQPIFIWNFYSSAGSVNHFFHHNKFKSP